MLVAAAIALNVALWPGLAFDRVDVLSEEPATWVNHELPLIDVNFTTTAIRWAEQIKPVVSLPMRHFYAGASISSLSLVYERPLIPAHELYWGAGVHTRWLLPRGLFGGLAWRYSYFRLALGAIALSGTAWARPDWSHWLILPTIGIGIGREYE